jgi:hypothetical protein
MSLWRNRSDWLSLSQFRDLVSSFDVDLRRCLCGWRRRRIGQWRAMCAFLILEAEHGKAPSMSTAADDAIPLVLQSFGARLDADLVELALRLAASTQGRPHRRSEQLLLSIALDSHFIPAVVDGFCKRLLLVHRRLICPPCSPAPSRSSRQ